MSIANLNIAQSELRALGAAEAGFPSSTGDWDTNQQDQMTRVLKRAVAQVLQPPIIPNEFTTHEWSWLHPIGYITVWPTFEPDGSRLCDTATTNNAVTNAGGSTFYESMVGKTITIHVPAAFTVSSYVSPTEITLNADPGNNSAILWKTSSIAASASRTIDTATAGNTVTVPDGSETAFDPSMVGQSFTIYVPTDYTIATYVSATEIRLSTDPGIETDCLWDITSDGTFRFGDEFAGLEGTLTHEPGIGKPRLEKTNENVIREYLAQDNNTGIPVRYAIRPVRGFTTAALQGWELLAAPLPDQLYTLAGQFHLNFDVMTTYPGTDKYLPGGSAVRELWRASMLAAVESEIFRVAGGMRYGEFMLALAAAVHHDRKHNFEDTLGSNRDVRPGDIYGPRSSLPLNWDGTPLT